MAFGLAIIFPTILKSFMSKLEIYMRMSIKDYDNIPETRETIFWNRVQTKVKPFRNKKISSFIQYSCCGLNDSISDYRDSYFHRLTGLHIPPSCCRSNRISCSNHPTSDNSFLNVQNFESTFLSILHRSHVFHQSNMISIVLFN